MLHVCMITSEFPPPQKGLALAGVGYYGLNLCNQLVKKGHKATVITRGIHKVPHLERINGIDVYQTTFLPVYPFHIPFHGIFVNKVFKAMESDFDIVHFQVPLPPFVKTSLPVVATLHSFLRAHGRRHYDFTRRMLDKIFVRYYTPLEFKIVQNADLITCVSARVARLVKAFYGFDSKVIPNAVDTDFFVPDKSHQDPRYVAWAGRLVYVKGLFDLIECAEYVCKEHPSISFLIAGQGPLMQPLRKLVKNRALEKKVIFAGQLDRENLRRHYQNSAIFALTSHVESFPTTVLEAMSCGVPVVATMAGDVPKVVKDGETGFLVPPKDPKAMAQRITYLLNDEDLRKKMGKASRKLMENEYSWNRISDKIIGCYKSVENIR